jgi:hypothetical protein
MDSHPEFQLDMRAADAPAELGRPAIGIMSFSGEVRRYYQPSFSL